MLEVSWRGFEGTFFAKKVPPILTSLEAHSYESRSREGSTLLLPGAFAAESEQFKTLGVALLQQLQRSKSAVLVYALIADNLTLRSGTGIEDVYPKGILDLLHVGCVGLLDQLRELLLHSIAFTRDFDGLRRSRLGKTDQYYAG